MIRYNVPFCFILKDSTIIIDWRTHKIIPKKQNNIYANREKNLLPIGNKANPLTRRLVYPAIASGCNGMLRFAEGAPSGTYNDPVMMLSMIAPPNVL